MANGTGFRSRKGMVRVIKVSKAGDRVLVRKTEAGKATRKDREAYKDKISG